MGTSGSETGLGGHWKEKGTWVSKENKAQSPMQMSILDEAHQMDTSPLRTVSRLFRHSCHLNRHINGPEPLGSLMVLGLSAGCCL